MGNCISQDQLATLMSLLKGHVHTLFANLCMFLLSDMTVSFLLNLKHHKGTFKENKRRFERFRSVSK